MQVQNSFSTRAMSWHWRTNFVDDGASGGGLAVADEKLRFKIKNSMCTFARRPSPQRRNSQEVALQQQGKIRLSLELVKTPIACRLWICEYFFLTSIRRLPGISPRKLFFVASQNAYAESQKPEPKPSHGDRRVAPVLRRRRGR